MKTADAARGKWAGILSAFGVDQSLLTGKHGPCPICGTGKDRFRFDDKDGNGTWFCNQCGAGNGIQLLMAWKGWDFKDAAREVDAIVRNVQESKQQRRSDPLIRLRKIAHGIESMDGINPVRLYLQRRGLSPTQEIKYHPRMDHWDESGRVHVCPAMVAMFQSVEGKPLSYHVTALTPDGKKACIEPVKKIMPPVEPLAGSAIRLTAVYPHIGIAEGIETALAVMRDYRIPCWAAANATLLEKFAPPVGVNQVTVFADNDENYAGQKAAYTLAHRIHGAVAVEVVVPPDAGTDFADILPMENAG